MSGPYILRSVQGFIATSIGPVRVYILFFKYLTFRLCNIFGSSRSGRLVKLSTSSKSWGVRCEILSLPRATLTCCPSSVFTTNSESETEYTTPAIHCNPETLIQTRECGSRSRIFKAAKDTYFKNLLLNFIHPNNQASPWQSSRPRADSQNLRLCEIMDVQCSYCKVYGHPVELCQAPDHATGLVKPRRSQFYNQPSEWIGKPWLYSRNKGGADDDGTDYNDNGPYKVIITGLDKPNQTKLPNQVRSPSSCSTTF